MEDGRGRAEAAEHRGRGVKTEPYRCGETLLIIFSLTFVSIAHSLLFSSLFPPPPPPPCLIITQIYIIFLICHHCICIILVVMVVCPCMRNQQETHTGNMRGLLKYILGLTLLLSQFCQLQTFSKCDPKGSSGFNSVLIIPSVLNKLCAGIIIKSQEKETF